MVRPATAAADETGGHPAPARHKIGAAPLLFGLLAAPGVAALETLVGVRTVGSACFPLDHPLDPPRFATQPIVWSVHAVALVVAVSAVMVSLHAWRRTRHERPGDHMAMVEIGEGRTRFVAMVALLTSLGFLILIGFNTLGLVFLGPC